jgi:hypothetical protein
VRVEKLLESFYQRIKVNIFNGYFQVTVPVISASSFALANINPVRSSVTGTLKSLFINEAFQQKERMIISFYPVTSYAPHELA